MQSSSTASGTRVTIVGCGNIGSRLLQALATIDDCGVLDIDALEPGAEARAVAEKRFAEAVGDRGHRLRMVADAVDLRGGAALGIVATDARNRLPALTTLLDRARPRRVLLEKVLFTRGADYEAAAKLLAAHGTQAWVNCSRNEWPGYAQLRVELAGRPMTSLTVSGSDWNLASNAIHFLALGEYLSGELVSSISWDYALPPEAREAKRAGYREVVGTLVARISSGVSLRLASRPGPQKPLVVSVDAAHTRFEISEADGLMLLKMHDTAETRSFKTVFTSQFGPVLSRILREGTSSLPTYSQSTSLHMQLLAALNEAFFGDLSLAHECPIT